MEQKKIYKLNFEIDALGTGLISSAEVLYQDFNSDSNFNISNIKLSQEATNIGLNKNNISEIIETNIKNLKEENFSLFEDSKANLTFNFEQIDLISKTLNNGEKFDSILEELKIDNILIKENKVLDFNNIER